MRRLPPIIVALACACGPLVPVVDTSNDGDSSATSGPDESETGAHGEVGEVDGVPPGSEVGEVGGSDEVGTGSIGVCGDGIVDVGEVCDDGNDEPGDGCELDCTSTPGLLLWSQTIDGDHTNDSAVAVAISTSGEVLVAGALRFDGNDDMSLHSFTADGTPSVASTIDFGDDEFGTAIAVTSDGNIYVAGLQPSGDRALLARLEGSGLAEVEGAPTDVLAFTALASPTAEGFVLVTNAGGFDDIVPSVRRFDPTGIVIGDVPQSPGVFAGAAAPASDGGTILGGGSFGGMGMGSSIWVSALASDGSLRWSYGSEPQEGVFVRVRGVATAPDGRIIAVGTQGIGGGGPGNGNDTGWLWWLSADGQPESDGPIDIGGASAQPNAVVVGAHGLVIGGSVGEDGFVGGFAIEDGALQWGYELAGELGLEDGVAALALDPGVGVAAVGWITQSTTNQDAWVAMFTD